MKLKNDSLSNSNSKKKLYHDSAFSSNNQLTKLFANNKSYNNFNEDSFQQFITNQLIARLTSSNAKSKNSKSEKMLNTISPINLKHKHKSSKTTFNMINNSSENTINTANDTTEAKRRPISITNYNSPEIKNSGNKDILDLCKDYLIKRAVTKKAKSSISKSYLSSKGNNLSLRNVNSKGSFSIGRNVNTMTIESNNTSNKKISNFKKIIPMHKRNKSSSSSSHIFEIRRRDEHLMNYDKCNYLYNIIVCDLLRERIRILKSEVLKYKEEKEKLINISSQRDSQYDPIISKLQNEIQSYKNVTLNCKTNCEVLTKEILSIQTELRKYGKS